MKKIVFLEGLPGVGKTTIINYLKNNSNVNVVDEIINNKYDDNRTNYFLKNDDLKYSLYDDGLIVIDRGFLSTISYEQTKSIINDDYDCSVALNWFNEYKKIYGNNNVFVIYLKRTTYKLYLPYNDENDPYGSIDNQELLEAVTLYNLKKYSKNYKIVNYSFENMMEVVNEIIS